MRCLAVGLMLAAGLWAQPAEEEPPHFREVRFGMSMAEVIAAEGKQPDARDDEVLQYRMQLGNFPVVLEYLFVDGRLRVGLYRFVPREGAAEEWFRDFGTVKAWVTERYWAPDEETVDWMNETWREHRDGWPLALASGHVRFRAVWVGERVRVVLGMSGGDKHVVLELLYVDPNNNPPGTSKKVLDQL